MLSVELLDVWMVPPAGRILQLGENCPHLTETPLARRQPNLPSMQPAPYVGSIWVLFVQSLSSPGTPWRPLDHSLAPATSVGGMKVEPLAALQFMKPELAGCNIASSADWGAHGSNLWWRVLVEPMESYQAISNKWREFGARTHFQVRILSPQPNSVVSPMLFPVVRLAVGAARAIQRETCERRRSGGC